LGGALLFAPLALGAAVSAPTLPQPRNAETNAASRLDLRWSAADLNLIANGGFETRENNGWFQAVQAQAGSRPSTHGGP
jgi:hypothetical protein